jgi:hypothetical protein
MHDAAFLDELVFGFLRNGHDRRIESFKSSDDRTVTVELEGFETLLLLEMGKRSGREVERCN